MNEAEYYKMRDLEDTLWWHRGTNAILHPFIRETLPFVRETIPFIRETLPEGGKGRLLDVGCGTGGRLRHLFRRLPGATLSAVGVDRSRTALRLIPAGQRGDYLQAVCGRLPFRDGAFDCVFLFDVLQAVREEGVALDEIGRVCKHGGFLLIHEVAFEFLMDQHSLAAHVVRRYTRRRLTRLVEGFGFRVRRATYSNFFLFPPIALVRLGNRLFKGGVRADRAVSSLRPYPRPLNWALTRVLLAEACLLRWFDLPFGVSLIVEAEKRG